MAEGLQAMLGSIAEMMAAPDADLEFLGQLNTTVLTKIRQPFDQMAQTQNAQAGMGGAPSPESMPPPEPQMTEFGPAAVPGQRNNPTLPNPDELRRVLSANGPGGLG
jgi:hypothetical protein